FAGIGCFIQGVGFLALVLLSYFVGWLGFVIGVVLFLYLFYVGRSKSTKWRCGNCKHTLPDKEVRVCPVCKANLE
ncbi:MAG: hypothetical protein ACP5LD_04280, partial [Desulfomonilaceae bacterium]